MNNQQQNLNQMTSSPLFKRAQEMANGKTGPEIEQVARNICNQKGVNYDEAVQAFQRMFGNQKK